MFLYSWRWRWDGSSFMPHHWCYDRTVVTLRWRVGPTAANESGLLICPPPRFLKARGGERSGSGDKQRDGRRWRRRRRVGAFEPLEGAAPASFGRQRPPQALHLFPTCTLRSPVALLRIGENEICWAVDSSQATVGAGGRPANRTVVFRYPWARGSEHFPSILCRPFLCWNLSLLLGVSRNILIRFRLTRMPEATRCVANTVDLTFLFPAHWFPNTYTLPCINFDRTDWWDKELPLRRGAFWRILTPIYLMNIYIKSITHDKFV